VSIASSDPESYRRYFEALWEEIELRASQLEDHEIVSLYFGGGTPSHVPVSLLFETVNRIARYAHFHDKFEFTVEVNPEDVTEVLVQDYLSMGVNRVSVGLQSARDEVLRAIGRPHTIKDFLSVWKTLERHFYDLNVDFIVGLPLEDGEVISENVRIIEELRPPHVSVYVLEEKEFDNDLRRRLPTEDETIKHFLRFCNALTKAGYRRYEISNWYLAKPSLHNLRYWENRDYLGLGLSAGGHIGWFRYVNVSDLALYQTRLREGKCPHEYAQTNTEEKELKETLFMCLRLMEGCDLEELKEKFSPTLIECYVERLVVDSQYFERCGNRLRLTPLGLLHSASALERLV